MIGGLELEAMATNKRKSYKLLYNVLAAAGQESKEMIEWLLFRSPMFIQFFKKFGLYPEAKPEHAN